MVGTTISHYEILEELGAGGMGTVFKALDNRLERTVALKFLARAADGSEGECNRLLGEARIAAAINHPNVCAILDIHDEPGGSFLVMEYVEGDSLRAEIRKGPMDPARALAVALQAAAGLGAAHRKGIVHRDIKPENILLDAAGTAKLSDFGLARKLDLAPDAPGLSGTVSYMSPEQLRGEPAGLQSDVWSLGVVIYEMLAGTRPFAGEYQQAVMYSIAHERHPAILESRRRAAPAAEGRLPRGLEAIVDRCLEKMSDVRYADADALLAELKQTARGLDGRAPEEDGRSIAVLPFEDLSSGGDNRYFSEGLTEEIIAGLSRLKAVKVTSRTTVIRYDRSDKDARQIAADLGVQFILEGSVRKRGSDVLITTRLIDARTDTQIWSEKYPGTMDDIFTIQETVASRIARALKLRLSPVEKRKLKQRPTASTEAYQLYLRGRYEWNKRNREGLEASIRYFERAIRKDRKYALAWAGLADAYNLLSEYTGAPRTETYPRARDAITKALEIDPQLAEARTSLASLKMLYEWNWPEAEKEFRLSLYLKPEYPTTHHWLAELLLFTGRLKDAVASITRAQELEPNSPAIARDMGMILYYNQRFPEAAEWARRTLAMEKTFITAHRLLSLAYIGMGKKDDALAENELWGELTGNRAEATIWKSYILAVSGEPGAAREAFDSVPVEQLSNGYQFRGMGIASAALGDADAAFAWFRRALQAHSESLASLNVDFKVAHLRGDPRFADIVKAIGVVADHTPLHS